MASSEGCLFKKPPTVQPGYKSIQSPITEEPQYLTSTDFKGYPVAIKCPTCHREGITMTDYQNGECTNMATCITCLILPVGCALIPYFMQSLKDVVHTCPYCSTLIAIYKR